MPSDSTLKPGPGAHSPEKVSFYFVFNREMHVFIVQFLLNTVDLHVQFRCVVTNICFCVKMTRYFTIRSFGYGPVYTIISVFY
jgi:hypothetical protein